MPAYWGIAALTGAGPPGRPRLFPHFRDTFYRVEETGEQAIRTFAVNNEANGVNVIVINTSESLTSIHDVTLVARHGRYDLFQTRSDAPFAPPERMRQATSFDQLVQAVIPPLSVSILIFAPEPPLGTSGGTPS